MLKPAAICVGLLTAHVFAHVAVNFDEHANGTPARDVDPFIDPWSAQRMIFGDCDPPDPCPADVNDDELVNVSDLLALINDWGPCPTPSECTAALSARAGRGSSTPAVSNAYNVSAGTQSTQLVASNVSVEPGELMLIALHIRSGREVAVSSALWSPQGGLVQPLQFVTGAKLNNFGEVTAFYYLKKPAAGVGLVSVQLEAAPDSYSAMSVLTVSSGNINAPIDAVAANFQTNPSTDAGTLTLHSTIAEGLAIHAAHTNFLGTMSSVSGWSIACNQNLNFGDNAGNFFVHHRLLTGAGAITCIIGSSQPSASFWNVGVIVGAASTQKLTADEAPQYCSPDMEFWRDLLAVQPMSRLVNLAAIGDSRCTYHSNGAGIASDMARGAYMNQKWGGSFATRIMFGTEYYGVPLSTSAFPITNSGCAWLSGFRSGAGVVSDLGTTYVPGQNFYDLLLSATSSISHALLDHNNSYPFLALAHHQLGIGASGIAEGNPALSYFPLDQSVLVDVWCFSKPGSGQLNVKVEATQDVRYVSPVVQELNGPTGEFTSLPLDSLAHPPSVHSQTFGPFAAYAEPNDRYLYVRLRGTNATGTRFLAVQIRAEAARGIATTMLGFPSQTSAWHTAFFNSYEALAGVGFDAVEIMFGAHDINTGNKTATLYAQAIAALVADIRARAPGMPIILRADWRAYNLTDPLKLDRHSEYAGALFELASTLSAGGPVLFKNTLGIINQELNFETEHAQYFPPDDYIHLSVSGAEAVEQADWNTFYTQAAAAAHATRCADVNCDGTVDVIDLLAVINAWGMCPGG